MDPIAIPMITAAGRGFAFADLYAIGLIFCAVALFAAIGALSHQGDRAFSASIIYLGLGAGAALAIELIGLNWLEPVEDAELIERVRKAVRSATAKGGEPAPPGAAEAVCEDDSGMRALSLRPEEPCRAVVPDEGKKWRPTPRGNGAERLSGT